MKPNAGPPAQQIVPATPPVAEYRPVVSSYGAFTDPNWAYSTSLRQPAFAEKTPLPKRPRLLATDRVLQDLPPAMPGEADGTPFVARADTWNKTEPTIVHVNATVTPTAANSATRPTPPTSPTPTGAEPELVAALRCFMDKRPDTALPHLNRYEPENQDVLLNLLPLTARMSEGPLSHADPQEIAIILDQLQGIALALQPKASLVMDKACFCRQVRKFGVYEALGERPSFRQGELVEVYCEIRNVTCERSKLQSGDYRTQLQSSLEIRNAATGWNIRSRNGKADVSHTPQHDYYLHYKFAIKDDMRPGSYVVMLEVVDVPTGRRASRKLEFVVRAE